MTILDRVCARDSYFMQKNDACGLIGLSSRQKITAALRMLALGVCADAMDDYCRTSESTAMECMKRFCVAMHAEFGEYHLRQPTRADFLRQLEINKARGTTRNHSPNQHKIDSFLLVSTDLGKQRRNRSIVPLKSTE